VFDAFDAVDAFDELDAVSLPGVTGVPGVPGVEWAAGLASVRSRSRSRFAGCSGFFVCSSALGDCSTGVAVAARREESGCAGEVDTTSAVACGESTRATVDAGACVFSAAGAVAASVGAAGAVGTGAVGAEPSAGGAAGVVTAG